MKLLCLADVHLGRVPARLHADLQPRAADLGPAEAWDRAVNLAVTEDVTAVLLAGDLIDGEDFFEAFSALRDGAKRLAAAGIQIVAVAGNHDPEVLARLVQAVPEVKLLGAGGHWEAHDLTHGAATVRLVGWSFPGRWVDTSPLADGALAPVLAAAPPSEEAPVVAAIGLLHTDRDQAGSRYAPVTSAELAGAGVNAWLLGHVHKPDLDGGDGSGRGYVGGYLGSLTSNDPGEPGPRGAWLLELDSSGALSTTHKPLAPLRWETLQLDVSDLGRPDELPGLVISSLEELSQRLASEGADPVAVGCRLVLSGRTPFRNELRELLRSDPPGAALLRLNGVDYFVDEVRVTALPALDLEALAQSDDPLGLLAARVVALRSPGSPLRDRLVAAATPRLEELRARSDFGGPGNPPVTEDEVVELLEEAALKALDALQQQRAGDEGVSA